MRYFIVAPPVGIQPYLWRTKALDRDRHFAPICTGGGPAPLSHVVAFVSDADVECGHDRVALPLVVSVSRVSVSEDGKGDREGLFLCVLGSNRGADATDSGSDLGDLPLVVVPEEGVQTSDLLVLPHGRLDDRRRIVTAGRSYAHTTR
jgi:hypothetical protein